MRTAPFLLRRVFTGVLIGAVTLLLGFASWVHYRTGQYHDREDEMLQRYRNAYSLCVTGGGAPGSCGIRAYQQCLRDPFWLVGKPYSFDLRFVQNEAPKRCQAAARPG